MLCLAAVVLELLVRRERVLTGWREYRGARTPYRVDLARLQASEVDALRSHVLGRFADGPR